MMAISFSHSVSYICNIEICKHLLGGYQRQDAFTQYVYARSQGVTVRQRRFSRVADIGWKIVNHKQAHAELNDIVNQQGNTLSATLLCTSLYIFIYQQRSTSTASKETENAVVLPAMIMAVDGRRVDQCVESLGNCNDLGKQRRLRQYRGEEMRGN